MKSLAALLPLLVFTSCATNPVQTEYQSQQTQATHGAATAVLSIGGSLTSVDENRALVRWTQKSAPAIPSADPVRAADSSIYAFRPTVTGDGDGNNLTSITGFLAESDRH